MSSIEVIVLGIIQGITEFWPISSTAHLRIVPAFFGWSDPGVAFTAVIQIGTLLAIVSYFYRELFQILIETIDGIFSRDLLKTTHAKMGWMIVAGTIPVVILGLLLKDFIKTSFRSMTVISIALIVFSFLLIYAENIFAKRLKNGLFIKSMRDMTWKDAIVIGLWQACALVPGASRSGVSISGGLLVGLSRSAAARYSFLLSIPSVLGAAIFQLIDAKDVLFTSAESTTSLIFATIISGVVGYFAIEVLLKLLEKKSIKIFAYYRIALGCALLLLIAFGFFKF